MGIPRLTQDVAPFAEFAIIGKSQFPTDSIEIGKVVIDGPSLVYHVFNALLRGSRELERGLGTCLPSYTDINDCFLQFLDDLIASGAQICRIIFDGALPLAKRATRLERLEKTSQNLDLYRKVGTFNSPGDRGPITRSPNFKKSNSLEWNRRVLWGENNGTSSKAYLLPPPTFMVASVIETLRLSKFADIIHIVPGEADPYCAAEARLLSAGILTNDSDLLVYDLGAEGAVVMLRSLSCCNAQNQEETISIQAQCQRPSVIVRNLNVPGLFSFAFQRSRDSSASTSTIAQRARLGLTEQSASAWQKFRKEYISTTVSSLLQDSSRTSIYRTIQAFDPRTAEIVCSLNNHETPHMYLPTVLEDPTRDSAWSYSSQIRRLAYSILFDAYSKCDAEPASAYVVEHFRKGSRIGEHSLSQMSRLAMLEEIDALLELFKYHNSQGAQAVLPEITQNIESGLGNSASTQRNRNTYCHMLAAAEIVIKQRLSKAKPYQPYFSQIFSVDQTDMRSSYTSWDELHFHATMQCTLYSIRMLRQLASHVLNMDASSDLPDLLAPLQQLALHLATMPHIQDLFLNPGAIRQHVVKLPTEVFVSGIEKLLCRVDPASFTARKSPIPVRKSLTKGEEQQQQDANGWQAARVIGRKRLKRQHVACNRKTTVKNRALGKSDSEPSYSNTFALLQDHQGSSQLGD
ncbi:hypothetical protein R6Q59_009836 [Mikania micrantha]